MSLGTEHLQPELVISSAYYYKTKQKLNQIVRNPRNEQRKESLNLDDIERIDYDRRYKSGAAG